MSKTEKILHYTFAILLGAAVGVLFIAIIEFMASPKEQSTEPTCAIERNTVVYPDGEDGEAKITNECLVKERN